MNVRHLLGALAFGCGLVACRSIGPGSVARDRAEYSDSISESWKRQTLLNIVKLRYLDPPIFVDVGQIVAGYSLETSVNAGAQVSRLGGVDGNNFSAGASAKYTDRPTITYVPLTGNRFVKSLMTPLPPEAVFFTIQSGWPADAVLLATAASINGLKNQETSAGGVVPPDPSFLRVLAGLRKIQVSGALAMRVRTDVQQGATTILTIRGKDAPPAIVEAAKEVRRLLNLDPDADEFELVFSSTAAKPTEIAVITRSMLHLMQTFASQVEVPIEDVAEGRATPGWKQDDATAGAERMLHVRSSGSLPDEAFVGVSYRGRSFWIDDRDLRSKRIFAFLMMLFTLADTSEREPPPLITIPAQ